MPVIDVTPTSKVEYIPKTEESFFEDARAQTVEAIKKIPVGMIESSLRSNIPALQSRENFGKLLEMHGAGPQEIASTLGEVLSTGSEKGRLRAAEVAMKSLGLLENQNAAQGNVTFTIQGENVNLQAVLQPKREKEIDE